MTAAFRRAETVSERVEALRRDTAYEPRPHSSWKGTVAELVAALRSDTDYDKYDAVMRRVKIKQVARKVSQCARKAVERGRVRLGPARTGGARSTAKPLRPQTHDGDVGRGSRMSNGSFHEEVEGAPMHTIAIPSYRRAEELFEKTYKCVLEPLGLAASTIVFIQTDEDEKAYRDKFQGTGVRFERAPKGFAEVNHYIENYFEVGRRVVIMHDDIKGILKLEDDGNRGKFRTLRDNAESETLFRTAFESMEAMGLTLGGVNSTRNSFFAKSCKDAISFNLKFIWDPLHFIISTQRTPKCQHFYFDDVERTIEAYKRDGGVLRMNHYAINSTHEPFNRKASGGLAGQRTPEGATQAAAAMKEEYGRYVKFTAHKHQAGWPKIHFKRLPYRRCVGAGVEKRADKKRKVAETLGLGPASATSHPGARP